MKIVQIKIDKLKPYKNNARTHSNEQIKQIIGSIEEFGFTNPLLIDKSNNIIAGHGRLEAAKKLKMEEIPCIILDNLTEVQRRALILADNKIALNASWSIAILKSEIMEIEGINLEVLGFSDVEIEELTGEIEEFSPTLEPKINTAEVTAGTIQKAQEGIDNTITDIIDGRKQVKFICPDCGEEFYINASDVSRLKNGN
jgi:ParB-like chromosome segregation protein Spo0J